MIKLFDDTPTIPPSENFKAMPYFQWHLTFFFRDVIYEHMFRNVMCNLA